MLPVCPGCNNFYVRGSHNPQEKYGMIEMFFCSNSSGNCTLTHDSMWMCKDCNNGYQFKAWKSVVVHLKSKGHIRLSPVPVVPPPTKKMKITPSVHQSLLLSCSSRPNSAIGNGTKSVEKEVISLPSCDLGKLGRKQSMNFYQHDNDGNRSGARYLITRACTRVDGCNTEITDVDIRLNLLLGEFCMDISRPQRDKLASILGLIGQKDSLNAAALANDDFRYNVAFPRTPNLLRSCFMLGEFSLRSNLPFPEVTSIMDDTGDNEHAYVSIIAIIADVLSRTTFPEAKSPCGDFPDLHHFGQTSTMFDSPRYQEIVANAKICYPDEPNVIIFALTNWSDDFEPNTGKLNRGGAWLQTCTVLMETKDSASSFFEYTHPIALGKKGCSHDAVEKKFSDELCSLRKPSNFFFHAKQKKMVPVYAELFASLQDQPERRAANYLLGGNSIHHARFGYACDHFALKAKLPSCKDCLSQMISMPSSVPILCTQCLNWSLDGDSDLLNFPCTHDFPLDETTNGMLRPVKLSYPLLKEKVALTRAKLLSSEWSYSTSVAHLKFFCLNEMILHDLIRGSHLSGRVQASLAKPHDPIHKMIMDDPNLCLDAQFPPLWMRVTALQNHIDVIMHLLFLGAVRTTVTLIRDWIKANSGYVQFSIYASSILRNIPKVNWCVAAPYTGEKLGGWVSENFLAFSRLMMWFYGPLADIVTKSNASKITAGSPPVGPCSSWKRIELVTWLQARGVTLDSIMDPICDAPPSVIDVAKKCVQEKRSISMALKQSLVVFVKFLDVDDPVGRRPPLLSVCDVTHIHSLIQSLSAMISNVMAPVYTSESINELEGHIKVFLSNFTFVTGNVYENIAKPKWLSSYNFLCLLNLPDMCRLYGPLRNIWEGSNKGEGFIRQVKPIICSGFRKNWMHSTLKQVSENMVIKRLVKENTADPAKELPIFSDDDTDVIETDDIDADVAELNISCSRDHVIYKDLAQVHVLFHNRAVISAVILGCGDKIEGQCSWSNLLDARCLSIIINGNVFIPITKTSLPTPAPCQVIGHNYSHWSLDEDACPMPLPKGYTILGNVFLMPMLYAKGFPGKNDPPLYTVMESQWRILDNQCMYLELPSMK